MGPSHELPTARHELRRRNIGGRQGGWGHGLRLRSVLLSQRPQFGEAVLLPIRIAAPAADAMTRDGVKPAA